VPLFGIGLLRFILATAVVMGHTSRIWGYTFLDGATAVETFYIISGFYMAMILDSKYSKLSLFYSNRFLRLYPIYVTVLLLTILFSLLQLHLPGNGGVLSRYLQYSHSMSPFTFIFLIVTNLCMIGQDWVMFLGFHLDTGLLYFTSNFNATNPPQHSFLFIPQAWTLGVEISFYLMAPWLTKRSTRFIALLALFDLLIRAVFHKIGFHYDPWSYRFFPFELVLFLGGILSYRYMRHYYRTWSIARCRAASAILIVVTLLFPNLPIPYLFRMWFYYALVMFTIPYAFNFAAKSWIDRAIGDLSYPIYISHVFLIHLYETILGRSDDSRPVPGLWVIPSAVLFAFLLQKWIQHPIDRYRERQLIKLT
jgi:peptidoglycan/LPS O-acetylase OafA/YrhL